MGGVCAGGDARPARPGGALGGRGARAPSGPARPGEPAASVPERPAPSAELELDRGVQAIRRTDPRFDPTRLAGYTAMIFRETQRAWMTRDLRALRDRLTSGLYAELQAQCDRLQGTGRASRVDGIEVRAEITEAWQESGRDYVTATIDGSMVDYTVEEGSDVVVDGSRTLPRDVEEFWTFTRPSGLNFWMLSAIQTS